MPHRATGSRSPCRRHARTAGCRRRSRPATCCGPRGTPGRRSSFRPDSFDWYADVLAVGRKGRPQLVELGRGERERLPVSLERQRPDVVASVRGLDRVEDEPPVPRPVGRVLHIRRGQQHSASRVPEASFTYRSPGPLAREREHDAAAVRRPEGTSSTRGVEGEPGAHASVKSRIQMSPPPLFWVISKASREPSGENEMSGSRPVRRRRPTPCRRDPSRAGGDARARRRGK